MLTVLFLCTGNTCRSPMAEYLLKNMIRRPGENCINVLSAGISAVPGQPANEKAIEVMKEKNIDLAEHETSLISKSLYEKADLILAMTESHKIYLQRLGMGKAEKVYTLKEYIGQKENIDIGDPYGEALSIYRDTRDELETVLKKLLVKLSQNFFDEGKLAEVKKYIKRSETQSMKVAIGSDHAGYELKQDLIKLLEEKEISFTDMGTDSGDSVDYPDFAYKVTRSVTDGEYDRGILVCGTGIGMSMAANKIPGARAALCHDVFSARAARNHNNANILTLGARVIGRGLAGEIVTTWLEAGFAGGRHGRRVDKMRKIEKGDYIDNE